MDVIPFFASLTGTLKKNFVFTDGFSRAIPSCITPLKVRIKASFCQASPVFHSSAESEKQWTVEQVDGAVCSLRCYGPNGLEARIMRAEALELCLVNIFTAGAPVLIRNLPMNFWPCLEGHHGIWQQRQGYDSSQVYFPNFARRIVVLGRKNESTLFPLF